MTEPSAVIRSFSTAPGGADPALTKPEREVTVGALDNFVSAHQQNTTIDPAYVRDARNARAKIIAAGGTDPALAGEGAQALNDALSALPEQPVYDWSGVYDADDASASAGNIQPMSETPDQFEVESALRAYLRDAGRTERKPDLKLLPCPHIRHYMSSKGLLTGIHQDDRGVTAEACKEAALAAGGTDPALVEDCPVCDYGVTGAEHVAGCAAGAGASDFQVSAPKVGTGQAGSKSFGDPLGEVTVDIEPGAAGAGAPDDEALIEALRTMKLYWGESGDGRRELLTAAADRLAAVRAELADEGKRIIALFQMVVDFREQRDALADRIAAVGALCDSYERSGYPDALIPKGQTINEFRRALGSSTGGSDA